MSECILVVGTTSDYIDHIRQHDPGRALFITDPAERARAHEERPDAEEEILCDLSDAGLVTQKLREHLNAYAITIDGVACYDCESLGLSASLARELALPFPSPAAVASSRNKFTARTLWQNNGVTCPKTIKVRTADEVQAFLAETKGPVVIKPLTGSGSELVFKCSDARQCTRAFAIMKNRLARHENTRMYADEEPSSVMTGARKEFVVEEFVSGTEYSCDFIVDGGRIHIIRTARKIPEPKQSFGTTLAYVLPGVLPEDIAERELHDQILRAAEALGIDRAVCMVDFIVQDDTVSLLEMTPRVGGDCLPPLILSSCGLDMITLALDFAQGKALSIPEKSHWRPLVGLRVFADTAGIIRSIDESSLRDDPRVVKSHIAHGAGSNVVLPPDDYDSRILGYIIFSPSTADIGQECHELAAKVAIEMEEQRWIRNRIS
ncbi:MAG TPA: ATP-grasp domain-containing protein [Deltaproteobacteria bacterium]|nr:ATP-grasp domain-containing protein [Deltaproteobacteria bacterium]